MKDLKQGSFVWHKELGRGIVSSKNTGQPEVLDVQFENRECTTYVNRQALFVKGDLIDIKKGNDKRWDQYYNKTFYEPMLHNPNCDSKYTYKSSEYINVKYARDIRHAGSKQVLFNEEQKLLNKVIDKTLINHPINATDISRTIFRAGQLADHGIKADKVLKEVVHNGQMTMDFKKEKGMTDNEARRILGIKEIKATDPDKEELLKRIKVLELEAELRELKG